MPNIWTHITFCESVVDTLQIPDSFLKQEAIMKLGAQGFAPFSFFNVHRTIRDFPSQFNDISISSQQCNGFLKDLIEDAKDQRKEIKSYVFGFVTNYILNCHTRPFIHYFAKKKQTDHRKLETSIDTLLMEKHYNLQTWKVPVYKEIDVGFSIDKDIAELIHKNSLKHFPEAIFKSSKIIQKAYRHMKLVLRIWHDPNGWKNNIFGSTIFSFSHRPLNGDHDYLNLEKKTWYHPITNKASTDSFEELYDQAKVETIEIMTEVLCYWNERSSKAKANLRKLLETFSYEVQLAGN